MPYTMPRSYVASSFTSSSFYTRVAAVAKLDDTLHPYLRQINNPIPFFLFQNLRVFQKTLEDVSARMAAVETARLSWTSPSDVNDARELQIQLSRFGERLTPLQRTLDEINDQASAFSASGVHMPPSMLRQLEDLNTRWKNIQLAVDERYKTLNDVTSGGGTTASQGFLSASVEPPWERAITPNKVPYYIK